MPLKIKKTINQKNGRTRLLLTDADGERISITAKPEQLAPYINPYNAEQFTWQFFNDLRLYRMCGIETKCALDGVRVVYLDEKKRASLRRPKPTDLSDAAVEATVRRLNKQRQADKKTRRTKEKVVGFRVWPPNKDKPDAPKDT